MGVDGESATVNVRACGARNRRMGSGDALHTLSGTGTDTDTSSGGASPTYKKKLAEHRGDPPVTFLEFTLN
jgi:hypothetical protein